MDQTEKYSTWLAESMNKSGLDSVNPSIPPSANSSRISSPTRQVMSDGMLIMHSVLGSVMFCVVSLLALPKFLTTEDFYPV